MDNPYIVGRPIRKPKNFFGRKEDINEIFSLIKKLQPISLVGQRKIGRTSLLHHITHPQVIPKYLNKENYILLYVNFEGLCELSQTQLWKLVLRKLRLITDPSINSYVQNLLKKEKLSTPDIYSLIENISNQDINIIFCFDEFESVTKNPNLNRSFFNNLRYMVSSYSNVSYITVTKLNLLDLTYSTEISSSPFFNIFFEKQIGFLNKEDTERIIFEPSKEEGIVFNNEDKEFIFDVAYNHPFFVQSACYYLFNFRIKHKKILGEKIETTLYDKIKWVLYKDLQNHFEYYWKDLNEKEKKRLKNLLNSNFNDDIDSIMIKLKNLSLIKENHGKFKIFSSIFQYYCHETEFIEDPF